MADNSTTPRGIRNNNPLNLVISNTPWLGKVTTNTDGHFEQFINIEYGIRAAMRNYKTILSRHLKKNPFIAPLIHIWAPASDGNDEKAYAAAVCKKAYITSASPLDIRNKNQTCRVLWAMAQVENGYEIPFQYFENAYAMAFNKNQ